MPSYQEVTQRAGSLRAMMGLTAQEFTALLPLFEDALGAYLRDRTMDGQPRTSRRYSPYDNCPLPTLADKLLFILTSLKQNPIQEVQGQLFGMSQSNANKWIHLLHAVWNQALAHPERLPARTADDLAALRRTAQAKGESTPPLLGLMVQSGRSIARKISKSNKIITAVRRSATRSKTSL
jgi:Helix-turn-helix of DDE superfamily endonuclease